VAVSSPSRKNSRKNVVTGKKTFWSRQDDPCSTFLGKNDSIVRKRILNPRFKSVLLEKD
jgi:hypothetical protein